jgi:hypothetical protein
MYSTSLIRIATLNPPLYNEIYPNKKNYKIKFLKSVDSD